MSRGWSPSGGSRADVDRPPAADGHPPLRRVGTLGTVVRVGFVAAVIGLTVYVLSSRWPQVVEAWSRVTPAPIGAALVFAVAATFCSFPPWLLLLRGLGSRLPLVPAGRVFFVGQLGKYIPGGVWAVLAQVTLARQLQVKRSRSAGAGLLSIVVSVVVAGSLSALCLALSGREILGRYAPSLLLVLVLVVFLHPGLLVRLERLTARVTHRDLDVERVPARHIALAVVVQAVGQILMGIHLWFVVGTVGGVFVSPVLAIGLVNIAFTAGLVAVFAPAGAGVREAVLVFGLSPFIPPGSALLVALMSRLLTILSDFVLAGVATVVSRRQLGRVGRVGQIGQVG